VHNPLTNGEVDFAIFGYYLPKDPYGKMVITKKL
jgi:hypothetical protein